MLFNTSVDYTNGSLMGACPARKKLFVTISIVCDLAILGFFKYFNFGLDNYNATMAALGIPKALLGPKDSPGTVRDLTSEDSPQDRETTDAPDQG